MAFMPLCSQELGSRPPAIEVAREPRSKHGIGRTVNGQEQGSHPFGHKIPGKRRHIGAERKNRKSGIYVAQDVLDAFTAYERALATPGGDTAIAKPVRATPQRVPRERR